MKHIKTLVLMQLRDKIDLSWVKTRKDRIHTVVNFILKFAILTLLYTAVLYAACLLGIVYYSDLPQVMTLMITIVMVLLLFSNTVGLTKALYFSEDNKVLITLPVNNNKIFVSKLLVFFIYELKRSFSFTIPIILGCVINISLKGYLPWITFLWVLIPLVIIVAIVVLISALLSIPALYGYRLVNKIPVLKVVLFLAAIGLYVFSIISIVDIIPNKIDLINQWPEIRYFIIDFLGKFESKNPLITFVTRTIIGEKSELNGVFNVNIITVLKVLIVLSFCTVLYLAGYFVSRPLFFKMMSKNFEFNKDVDKVKKNRRHLPFISFNIKELKVSIRSMEVSLNYLLVYITTPLLIFILDKFFAAMDKSVFGTYLSYSFNILIIVLPMLFSNGLIATLYSKEGRAGYIKKTKPVKQYKPLLAKLSFNIVLSIPSVIMSVLIFSNYVDVCVEQYPKDFVSLGTTNVVLLIFAVLFLYYSHLFYSATLDIMNPLNEAYATSGSDVNNENENRSMVMAFILSAIFALYTFILFNEATISTDSLFTVCIKLFVIGTGLAIYFISNFFLRIKAFYAQGKE